MIDNWDFAYDEDEEVVCKNPIRKCGWTGKMKDTKQRYVHTDPESWAMLAGRKGYEYDCPRCGWTVAHHYTRMS